MIGSSAWDRCFSMAKYKFWGMRDGEQGESGNMRELETRQDQYGEWLSILLTTDWSLTRRFLTDTAYTAFFLTKISGRERISGNK